MKSMRSIFCLLLAAALCLFAAISCAATLTLPANLRAIEAEAFCGDTSLDEVVLPEGLERIESRAFAGSSVSVINLPDSIEAIDEDAFENCENVSVMVEIGTYAFDWAKAADLSIIPIAASEDDFVYTSSSKGITITEYTGNDKHIVIPEKIKNKKVIAIDSEWLVYNIISYHIKSVWIPSTVSSIEAGAFDFCKELEEINIYGNNTTYFSKDGVLFNSAKKSLIRYPEGKQNITTYIVPDEIQIIGDSSFYSNKYIKQVVLSDNITSIGEGAFIGCDSLEDINIPDGITELIDVFRSCKSLKNVKIPDSVVLIGDDAFAYCESLTNIVIPSSVKEIGFFAFAYCSNLLSIEIPASVQKIGDYAFIGSSDDFAIYGEAGSYAETYAEENSFPFVLSGASNDPTLPDPGASPAEDFKYEIYTNKVTITRYIGSNPTVVIPSVIEGCSVTSIGDRAFYGCSGLTNIAIPDSVTSIGRYAFDRCTLMTSITIPNSVTSIGEGAFYDCSGLTSITIPNSVTSIAEVTFYDCSGLTSITIPDSVRSIKENAFENCSGLTSITIPDSVTTIGTSAFQDCSGLTSITIPDSVTSIAGHTFYGCSGLTSITISDSVMSIGYRAFEKCSSLTSITIPDSVTSIVDRAFYDCSGLTNITIPDSVTSIGEYAFYGCSGLTNITIPDSVTSIEDGTFGDCHDLTSITIPESVTRIKAYAFISCTSLMSITIPNSVTNINRYAFDGCNNLTIYGTSGSYAETYAAENGIPFSTDEMPNVFATISDFTLNATPTEITVPVGSTLTFGGTVNAGDGAQLVDVQASVFDASDPTKGVKVARAENINAETFDLSSFADIVVGKTYSDDKQTLTMEAGKSYDVMLYATNTNGCGFASIPTIRVNVVEAEETVPRVISVDFDKESTYLDAITPITVRTDENANVLIMYGENRDWGRCAVWSVATSRTTVVDGVRIWNVDYVFNMPGDRMLSFSASTDGTIESEEETAAIKVVERELDITVQDFRLSRYIAEPENTIGISGIVSAGERELQLVTVSLCPIGDVESGVEIWSCMPNSTKFDLSEIPELIVGETYSGFEYPAARAYNRSMLLGENTEGMMAQSSAADTITMKPGNNYEVVVDASLADGTTVEEEHISRAILVRETTVYTGEVATKTSEAGKKFIKTWEGLKLREYDDGEGNPTIGYGHKIVSSDTFEYTIEEVVENGEVKKYRVITEEVADALFENDVLTREKTVEKFLELTKAKVNQQQYDALSSFFFNGNANPKTGALNPDSCMATLFAQNANSLDSIPDWRIYNQFANYYNRTSSNVEVRRGLHKRRLDEARIFTEGIYKKDESWYVEEWVVREGEGGKVDDNWYPRELNVPVLKLDEVPSEWDYPDIILNDGTGFTVQWAPIEGANYYNLYYRLDNWEENRKEYIMCKDPAVYLNPQRDGAKTMWISVCGMIDSANHGPFDTIEIKISGLGDVYFLGYDWRETVGLDISTIDTNNFRVSWACRNAEKYHYKVLQLAEKPGGDDQSGAALKTPYEGIIPGTSLVIPSEYLEVGKYLKVAVAPIDENGHYGTWRWTGFKVENSKLPLAKPVWTDSNPREITSGEKFTISWKPVENAIYYNVWYRVDGTDDMLYKKVEAPASSAELSVRSATDSTLHVSLYALTSSTNYSESAYIGIPIKGVKTIKMSDALYDVDTGYISCKFNGYVTTKGMHEGIDFNADSDYTVRYGKNIYSLIKGEITRVAEGYDGPDRGDGTKSLSTIAIYDEVNDKTVVYLHADPDNSLYKGKRINIGDKLGTESYRQCSSKSGTHTHIEVRDGRQTHASVSSDYTLVNDDPTDYWNSWGYTVE